MRINLRGKRLPLLLVILGLLSGCHASYSAKSIEGWIIDEATKKPIAGANVVAHWVLALGMEGGGGSDLVLMEAVTDKKGRYFFPPWGPVKVPDYLPWDSRLKSQDPEIIVFKRDYWPTGVSNEITGPYQGFGQSVRSSEWDGKTISLKKFDDSLDNYGSAVSGALTGVSWGTRCRWKQIPRTIVALDKESERLRQQGVFNEIPTINRVESAAASDGCGSVKDFFSGYAR